LRKEPALNNSQENKNYNIRMLITDGLMMILEDGRKSDAVINKFLKKYPDMDKRDRAFFTRVLMGTVERCITIDYVISLFSKVKLNKIKTVMRNILRMSVYQILYMDSVPDSAACNEAVKLVKKRGMRGLSGFCNGVLRNIGRNKDNIEYPNPDKDEIAYLSVKYSIPKWIIEVFARDYGRDVMLEILKNAEDMMQNGNDKLTVRINGSKISVNDVIESLKSNGCKVFESDYADNVIKISGFDRIEDIEELKKGYIQVQDTSSVLVGNVSGIKKGDRVLDMCGAPGGKTIHALDILDGSGVVVSGDVAENKLEKIKENANRAGFENIEVMRWDARVFNPEYEDKFDVVIADVPCSGLGVIFKKPDIKYRVTEDDILSLSELSKNILLNGIKYLKKDGTLIFSTCTVNKTENEKVYDFLRNREELETSDITDNLNENILNKGNNRETAARGFIQLFPNAEYDGFFISKYRKK